jgi:transposase-like protein
MTESKKPAGRAQRRTPAQWAELVQDYETSGQSQRGFCAARGIGQSSLRYWKRRLEKRSAEAPVAVTRGVRLVPVDLLEEHAALSADSGVTIRTGGGARIEVKRHFDASVLRGVVAALEAQE